MKSTSQLPLSRAEADRFFGRVAVGGPDECWPYVGVRPKTSGGYRLYHPTGGGQIGSHVFALMLKLGRALRPGMDACHSCDFKPCCNPEHLSEGTRLENMAQAVARGRMQTGELHWSKRNPDLFAATNEAALARARSSPAYREAKRLQAGKRDRDNLGQFT